MASQDDDDDLEALKLAALASMKKKSQVKNEPTDDLEDPELIALREAALLTKKTKNNQNDVVDKNQFQTVPQIPPSYGAVTEQYQYPTYQQPGYPYSGPPPPPGYPPPQLYSQTQQCPPGYPVHPNQLPCQSIPGVVSHSRVDSHHSVSSASTHTIPVTAHQLDVGTRGGSPFTRGGSPFTRGESPFTRGGSPFARKTDRTVGNNLIVITQAGYNSSKKESEKTENAETKPQLLRPQDKWSEKSNGKTTASEDKRRKTSDKFSRFESSDDSESDSDDDDDDDLLLAKDSISSDDEENDSNKENSDNSRLSISESLQDKEASDEMASNNASEQSCDVNDKPLSKENNSASTKESIGASINEIRSENLILSKGRVSESERELQSVEQTSSVSSQNENVSGKRLSEKKDMLDKGSDVNSGSRSRDRVLDLSEKLKNRKLKMENDLSEKLLNRKSSSKTDLSEKLTNRKLRKEGDLSDKLSSRNDVGRKEVEDLSHKLSSRKNKSKPDADKNTLPTEQLLVDSPRSDRKLIADSSDIPTNLSGDARSSKIRMMEEELRKLEARKQKFQAQKSLDLNQVQKTISLKEIKKRKKKKEKKSRSRSRSLPRQYRHSPRPPSLPRQFRDVPGTKSRSPHQGTHERSRSVSLPKQYRDQSKQQSKERKGREGSKIDSSHKADDKPRNRNGDRQRDRRDVRRRLSGTGSRTKTKDQSLSVKRDRGVRGSRSDEDSTSNTSVISDIESDDSNNRSWRTESNKNRIRRRSSRDVRHIPSNLDVLCPVEDRQHPNRNRFPPDRFRDRRKRPYYRDRFNNNPPRYDNFTVKSRKPFQSIASEEEEGSENGDRKLSSSIVLVNRNNSSLEAAEDEHMDTDSFKNSLKTKRVAESVLDTVPAKRKVISCDGVRSTKRKVTADYDSEFNARSYLKSKSNAADKDLDDEIGNYESSDDGKHKQLSRDSVKNRLGFMVGKSEKETSRNTLKPVLKNTEERTVKRVKSKSKDVGLYEDDLEIKIRQIKEKNAAILKRQEEIRKDKERFG